MGILKIIIYFSFVYNPFPGFSYLDAPNFICSVLVSLQLAVY